MTITDYGSWMKPYPLLVIQSNPAFNTTHVHPLISIRTPHYFGQFPLLQGKDSPAIISLNSTRLIRTPCFYGPINLRINGGWLPWYPLYTLQPQPPPHPPTHPTPQPCSRVIVHSLRARNKVKAADYGGCRGAILFVVGFYVWKAWTGCSLVQSTS